LLILFWGLLLLLLLLVVFVAVVDVGAAAAAKGANVHCISGWASSTIINATIATNLAKLKLVNAVCAANKRL